MYDVDFDNHVPFGAPLAKSERRERDRLYGRGDADVSVSRDEYVTFRSPSHGNFLTTTAMLVELCRFLPEGYRHQIYRYILTTPKRLSYYPCTDDFWRALRVARHERDADLKEKAGESQDSTSDSTGDTASKETADEAPDKDRDIHALPTLRFSHVIGGKRIVLVAPVSNHQIEPGDRYAIMRDPDPVTIYDPSYPEDYPGPRRILGYVDTFGHVLKITRTVPGSRIVFGTIDTYIREDPHTVNALFANLFGALKIEHGMRARPVDDEDLKNAHLYAEALEGSWEGGDAIRTRLDAIERRKREAEVVIDDPSRNRERHP